MSLNNRTILVTGGAGFIGSHVAKRLKELGARVIIVDNFNGYYSRKLKLDRVKELLAGQKIKIYRINIANLAALERVFKTNKIDLICHQAAQAGVRYSLTNPFVYQESNLKGMLNLLELSKSYKVKGFIFASSSSVYGESAKTKFNELDRTDSPVSLYAATKKADELLAYSYHKNFGLNITALRYFTVYGPWARPDMALFKFTKAIMSGKQLEIYNGGKMKRDFTYIDDIVTGVILAMKKNLPFEIINLGFGSPRGVMDMVKAIEKCSAKKAKIKFMPIQKGDVVNTSADTGKAKRILGWRPKTKLEDGVANFVRWYRDYYRLS